MVEGNSTLIREFSLIQENQTDTEPASGNPDADSEEPAPLQYPSPQSHASNESRGAHEAEPAARQQREGPTEPTQIITGKKNHDGSAELRTDTIVRAKPASDGTRGTVDIRRSKDKARDMINKGDGVRLTPTKDKEPRPTRDERMDQAFFRQLKLTGLEDQSIAIKMNLLSKSGLVDNRVVRDLNILEASVKEAARHLREDQLQPTLDRHFMLDNLDEKAQKAIKEGKAADGCVTAALLMMNAAMLHQRIANGRWLSGIRDLSEIKNDVNVIRTVRQEWERIMRRDFHPVLVPAVNAIEAIEDTGKLAGLERALHHLTAEAERIAETYADMGADHAGPLFNRVMGNQTSDGAFFTRPVAASIAARLTLDACGRQDWTDPQVWRQHKTVDLACGSGTLLAAMLTDMKRRAREQGAGDGRVANLQKLAVEETVKGLDINPISLQLAASQLTAGNHEISYRRMGLHLMPWWGCLPRRRRRQDCFKGSGPQDKFAVAFGICNVIPVSLPYEVSYLVIIIGSSFRCALTAEQHYDLRGKLFSVDIIFGDCKPIALTAPYRATIGDTCKHNRILPQFVQDAFHFVATFGIRQGTGTAV